jgi:hypothetical protein
MPFTGYIRDANSAVYGAGGRAKHLVAHDIYLSAVYAGAIFRSLPSDDTHILSVPAVAFVWPTKRK